MEITIGIGALLAVGLFAIVFGSDIQAIAGQWLEKENRQADGDDPNSTLSVTRQVLSEIGDREPCQ